MINRSQDIASLKYIAISKALALFACKNGLETIDQTSLCILTDVLINC